MVKNKKNNFLGGWAFLIGVILAIVIGFFEIKTQGLTITLFIIGIIIGLFNISDDEVYAFLISGIILIIAGVFGQSVVSTVPVINSILESLSVIFVPATIIVAIKNVFRLARH